MNRARLALFVLLLAVHSVFTPLMAFTVGFSCTLSSAPADGVTDIGGSVTMTVDVYDVVIEGLPDGEVPDENSLQIDYRWLTGKCPEEGVPTMTVQAGSERTFTVSYSWEHNNKMRPDILYDYAGDKDVYEGAQTYKGFYHGTSLTVDNKLHLPSSSDPITQVRNAPEIFSYAAEAWGEPVGVLPEHNSNSDYKFELFDKSVNLGGDDYQYDEHHYSHGRQFRSNIIMEWNYWKEVLSTCLRP